jgi:hypothetical protein
MTVPPYRTPLYKNMTIDLQPPASGRGVFTTGDAIKGTLRVCPTQRPRRIVLNLIGKTSFSNGAVVRLLQEEVLLFSHTLVLFSSETNAQSYAIVNLGNGIQDDGRVGLGFEFKMPGKVERDSHLGFKPRYGFEQSKGGILPPRYVSVTSNQIVEYYLEGMCYGTIKEEADEVVQQQVRQTVRYCPPSTLLADMDTGRLIPTTTYLEMRGTRCQTHRLHPNWSPDEGVLKKVKRKWTKYDDSTPHATFRVLAKVPETTVIGNVIPIELSLEHLERSPEIIEQPTIFLRKVQVILTSVLEVRVPHIVLPGEAYYSTHEESRNLFVKDFGLGRGEILYDGQMLKDLGMQRLSKVVPGFSSYGLYLWWKIEVKISVECANENFDNIGVCKGPIKLLSGLRSYDGVESDTSNGNGPSEEEDVPPPPYESIWTSP